MRRAILTLITILLFTAFLAHSVFAQTALYDTFSGGVGTTPTGALIAGNTNGNGNIHAIAVQFFSTATPMTITEVELNLKGAVANVSYQIDIYSNSTSPGTPGGGNPNASLATIKTGNTGAVGSSTIVDITGLSFSLAKSTNYWIYVTNTSGVNGSDLTWFFEQSPGAGTGNGYIANGYDTKTNGGTISNVGHTTSNSLSLKINAVPEFGSIWSLAGLVMAGTGGLWWQQRVSKRKVRVEFQS